MQASPDTRRRPTVVSWSSGKDSAWMLHLLQARTDIDVVALMTTIDEHEDRVAVHSVRRELLRAQAKAAGLPLSEVMLPERCTNAAYEAAVGRALAEEKARGAECVAFGDLFLQDIRDYREEQLRDSGLEPLFPLFGLDTRELAQKMLAGGLRARITCVDPERLDASFAGREFDESLLRDLPGTVDPCGENGEFHTAVYAGPMFRSPLKVSGGAVTRRGSFVYSDLHVVP